MSNRTTYTRSAADINQPRTQQTFRKIKLLVSWYLGITALTVVAIVLLRNHTAEVNSAVWTHGIIVVASALLTFSFSVRAARGARRAYLRLRIISIVMPVAIVAIIALPGTFPLWMKIEQGVCGVLLIGVAILVNAEHLRSLFATHASPQP